MASQAAEEIVTITEHNLPQIYTWVSELSNPVTRENAIFELGRICIHIPNLALLLWNSFGTIAALVQEITNLYPMIPSLTEKQSNNFYNTLSLLHCVAVNPETNQCFVKSRIVDFLIPLLSILREGEMYEYLKLKVFGIVIASIEYEDEYYLHQSDLFPICLCLMVDGSERLKISALIVVQKLIRTDSGLHYVCSSSEKFSHLAMVLGKMVIAISKQDSKELLQPIIRTFIRLSHNPMAREACRQCLPDPLRDRTFSQYLQQDTKTRDDLFLLFKCLESKGDKIWKPNDFRPIGDILPL